MPVRMGFSKQRMLAAVRNEDKRKLGFNLDSTMMAEHHVSKRDSFARRTAFFVTKSQPWSLFLDGSHALQTFSKPIVLFMHLRRQTIAEFLEELSDVGVFLGPVGGFHAQQFVHRLSRDV